MNDVGELDEASEAWRASLNMVLSISAGMLLRRDDFSAFMDWASDALPYLLLSEDAPRGAKPDAHQMSMASLMGRAIYAAMPLPSRRFRPVKMQWPERNEPCCCGSGRKFKLCCADLARDLPRFPPEMCAAPMLDAMGKAAWAGLPQAGMPIALVGSAAHDWRERGRLADVLKLLEPWLPPLGAIPDDRAELLDLLGDVYADLNKPRKRKALAQAMTTRGGREVQSKGWQRLALMACDAGKDSEASEAFKAAQRLTPDDLNLSVLELSLLIGSGDTSRLRERADFWARSLQRKNQGGDLDELIAMVRDMGTRGHDVLADVAERAHPELGRLSAWLRAAPPPTLLLDFKAGHATPDDLGALRPAQSLLPALQAWDQTFDQDTPSLTGFALGDGSAWADFEDWMPLLERHPALANSFEVLDGLMLLLDAHPGGERVAADVIQRAVALWAQLKGAYPQALCEWGHLDNRPALRLLARHIVNDDSARADTTFDWLRHLVEVFNPNDNHGLRVRLMAVYIRRGLHVEALALSDRYPDDTHAMALLRARALWAAGRRDEATTELQAVFARSRHFAKVWRSAKLPAASRSAFITYGSEQEAREAYREQHDLWQEPSLRAVIMAASAGKN
jgi:tetratricopeptide (TPR) repeat protein